MSAVISHPHTGHNALLFLSYGQCRMILEHTLDGHRKNVSLHLHEYVNFTIHPSSPVMLAAVLQSWRKVVEWAGNQPRVPCINDFGCVVTEWTRVLLLITGLSNSLINLFPSNYFLILHLRWRIPVVHHPSQVPTTFQLPFCGQRNRKFYVVFIVFFVSNTRACFQPKSSHRRRGHGRRQFR